jgi:hypothetical protein
MAKNRLQDLRNHLFETLEALKDEEKPMDVDRARAVAEVAHAIINSAKLELSFLELKGQEAESDFLSQPKLAISGGPPQLPTLIRKTED